MNIELFLWNAVRRRGIGRGSAGPAFVCRLLRVMRLALPVDTRAGQTVLGEPSYLRHMRQRAYGLRPRTTSVCLSLHCALVGLMFWFASAAYAGPPFVTDDPEPVDYQHWEFYLFANGDHASGGSAINGPAAELNYGVLPDTQLHLVVPALTISPDNGPSATGLGDTEFGIKYRFVHESDTWPQIGIFPMAELPTGDSDRSLGNGRTWFRLARNFGRRQSKCALPPKLLMVAAIRRIRRAQPALRL